MSNYTKTTDFEAKDSLPTGDSGKIIRGSEFETEFDAISTAIGTKADTAGPTFTGTLTFETISDGTIGVTAFVDEDDMSSNSATLVPTQQSVKAYVDSQVTAQDLDFQADTGGALSIDLDSETLTFTGGTGIDTSGSGNAVTFAIDSTVATLTGSQTLTNKTLTSPVLNTGVSGTAVLDEDDMSSNSATQLATQQSIKAYVDSQVGANNELSEILANGNTTGGTNIVFGDSASVSDDRLVFGAGSDLQIYHSGTHSYIDDAGTGNLTLRGNASVRVEKYEGEILADFAADGAVSLYHDNSVKIATTSTGVSVTGNVAVSGTVDGRDVATDGTKLDGIEASADVTDTANVTAAGALMDSELTSEASVKALNQGVATTDSPTFAGVTVNGTVEFDGLSGTGSVNVTDILDQDDMSSNSATALATQQSIKAYVDSQVATVDTLAEVLGNGNTTGGTDIAVGTGDDITFADSSKAIFGAGSDLQIYHDGSASYIDDQGTGSIIIKGTNFAVNNSANSQTMIAGNDGADVKLFYAGANKLATTSTGIDVTGVITTDGMTTSADINFGDNDKAVFGAGSDLQIYHNGSHSFLSDQGTGNMLVLADNFEVNNSANNENKIVATTNGAVTLYYDNAAKIATTSTGINVTGLVESDEALIAAGTGTDAIQTLRMGSGSGGTNKASINFQNSAASEIFSIDFNNSTGTFDINGDIGGTALSIARAGAATFNNTITIPDYIIHDGNTATKFGFGAANTINFISNGSDKLTLANTYAVFNDASTDTDFRVESNNNTHMLFVDAGSDHVNIGTSTDLGGLLNVGGSIFAKTTSAGTAVKIESSEAGATAGPGLVLYRSSASPADNDSTGNITFEAKNDAAQDVGYANINSLIEDASDGTEDGMLIFKTIVGGTARSRIAMTTGSGTVFNEDSQDLDFRVESDSNANMLFIDGGNNRVGLRTNAPSDTLDVRSGGIRLYDNTDGNGGVISFGSSAGYQTIGGGSGSNNMNYRTYANHVFKTTTGPSSTTDGTERMSIGTGVVINETGADADFRVESDNQANMFVVDASADKVGIGGSAGDTTLTVRGSNNSAGDLYTAVGAGNTPGIVVQNAGTTDNNNAAVFFKNDAAVVASVGARFTNHTTEETELRFSTTNSSGATRERVFIKGDGTFNVGTATDLGATANVLAGTANNTMYDAMVLTGGANSTSGSGARLYISGTANDPINRGTIIEGKMTDNGNTHQLNFYTSGNSQTPTRRMHISHSEIVANDDSVDMDFRVESDNNFTALFVDAGNDRIGLFEDAPTAPLHLTTTSAGTAFLIESSDAGSNGGPIITLDRSSSSPANGDVLGMINFNGRNDAGEHHNYARIESRIVDVANATEDGRLELSTSVGTNEGTSRLLLNGTETVVNDNSADLDFRVESNNNANMFFVDGGSDKVGIGRDPTDNDSTLQISADATSSTGLQLQCRGATNENKKLVIGYDTTSDIASITAFEAGVTHRPLHLQGSIFVWNEDGSDHDFRVESDSNANMIFVDAGNNQVNIGGSSFGSNVVSLDTGRIRVQKTTDWNMESYGDSSSNAHIRFLHSSTQVGGITTTASATTYATSSDARLKENIADADDAGELIDAIQVRQFDWIADGEHQRYGMVAQELNTVAPEAVSEGETEDDMMAVDYSKLVPMLIKEIQSLRARVAQLESN